ncbi:Phosphofurin acidic cluster sorting protein 2 [Myotis brandtii]|uniref:Phosphofurin acidic cluster sorting protein 2 n=1 Tax=Myotis brandtii TaxID=109478 RepID=S7MYT6_MYOBR|nr:Phosphofurin acidic cluster sorting protein 2 [Myotis brandtii]
MTQQQNYHQKVLLWLHTVKVSEEIPDIGQEDLCGAFQEVEEDMDLLYYMLKNTSDSGPDIEDDDSVLSTPTPQLSPTL